MWQPILEQVRLQQDSLDRHISGWLQAYASTGSRIFCAKGCRSCCSLMVNCTFPEALASARSLPEALLPPLRAHLQRLVDLLPELTDLRTFLRLHRQRLGFCPFLDEQGCCGIYGMRPLSCRTLLATKESRWCGADFAAISSEEKQQFVASLDQSIVSFPMHYVAATQEQGQELELNLSHQMATACGFSIYGNLPVLVWLERELGLSQAIGRGYEATAEVLKQSGLNHPFLVMVDR